MKRLLPLVLFALVACEPREDPNSPETEATPTVTPAPKPNVAPPVAPAAAPVATATATPAATAPATAGPVACGDKQCSDSQICVETQMGASGAVKEPPPPTYVCANEPMKSAGFSCTDPKDRRQRCTALAPGAAH